MSSPGSSPSTGRSSFLVHIGPRKTGTSSIQHALQSRRDALRAQGVVYPGSGSQHHTVVNRFLGRRQMWEVDLETEVEERPWRRMLREVGDAPLGVVSTEVLSTATCAELSAPACAVVSATTSSLDRPENPAAVRAAI